MQVLRWTNRDSLLCDIYTMTLIAANIMGKLLYTTSLQWMNTLLCDFRPNTGKCFATHLASLRYRVYKKCLFKRNQKAEYVYRNLDWFEKWQSDDGNIVWSYQCSVPLLFLIDCWPLGVSYNSELYQLRTREKKIGLSIIFDIIIYRQYF